jgi:Tat protein secretion system quality control protein TatD with DNase activity
MDVHSHAIEDAKNLDKLDILTTKAVFLMSTRKEEWDLVKKYKFPFIPCFGIHPWFAHKHRIEDLDKLRNLLLEFPEAMVGEIGVDKVAVSPEKVVYDFAIQQEYFEKQMKLAAEFNRPVCIHCVHAFGYLLDYFRIMDKDFRLAKKTGGDFSLPHSIMLHSFSGSSEISRQLLKLPEIGSRFYFSFSFLVNGRGSKKMIEKINSIPDDRILLESDSHSALDIDEAMDKIIDLVSHSKSWNRDFAIEKTIQNSVRFLKRL